MAFLSATGGIREEIASRLNEAESDNTDTYTRWINMGLRNIANEFERAPFLQTSADHTLASNARLYQISAAASNFEKMNSVIYAAGDVKLEYLPPDQFDLVQPSATETGTPTIYTIRGQGSDARIEFYPVPGSGISVHYDYQKEMVTVSVASSIPEIPEKYYELLALYGELQGLNRRGRVVEYREKKNEYENMKQRMIDDLKTRTTESVRIIDQRTLMAANKDYGDAVKNVFHNT